MEAKQTRRRYSTDFKREAVQLALKRDEPITQIADKLGIHSIMLHRWIKAYKDDQEYAFPGNGKLKAPDEEMRQLKKRLRDAEEERDILKKALGIFSKHPG